MRGACHCPKPREYLYGYSVKIIHGKKVEGTYWIDPLAWYFSDVPCTWWDPSFQPLSVHGGVQHFNHYLTEEMQCNVCIFILFLEAQRSSVRDKSTPYFFSAALVDAFSIKIQRSRFLGLSCLFFYLFTHQSNHRARGRGEILIEDSYPTRVHITRPGHVPKFKLKAWTRT